MKMETFKKMFTFMRPYMVLYSIGMLLYNYQLFVFSFAIGLLGSNVMAGVLAGDTSEIVSGTVIAISVFVVFFSLVGLGIYLIGKAVLHAKLDLKQTLFRSFIQNDLETSQSGHSGEGIAAINTEADTATGIWVNALSALLMPLITIVFSLVTVLIVEWRLGLAAVALGLIAYFMQSRFVKPLAVIGKERLNANAEAVKSVSDISQGALSIRAFNMQDKALQNASKSIDSLKFLSFREAFISMWQSLFTTVQGWLALIIVFGFGGWLVATQGVPFPVLLLVLPLVEEISSATGDIGQAIAGFQAPLVAAERIFVIIESEDAPKSEEKGVLEIDGSALHIKDLNFKYKNAEKYTLHDINLSINVGEMVAFVGASGSGKSTILRILAGFYERVRLSMASSGTSVNSAKILGEAVKIAAWRENFAYVDQSCKLFDMTIKENIAMGRKGNAQDADIVAAAKQAFAHDFIELLEQKYDSPCGEKGDTLSGGQKQRIAIARALLKGSPILVFDEATSALDGDSERYVMEAIDSLRNDHTILITTHNLTTITTADKIVVLDNGEIAEIGKHDELMSQKGRYAELWESQAAM